MNEEERAYYRAVEDHFARLRGTPFLVSPRDFALLRSWWDEEVPLAAVLNGISEVMERRRERGEAPVSSLRYCRHAVAANARRLAAAVPGGEPAAPAEVDAGAVLRRLSAAVGEAARRWGAAPAVASELDRLARAVATLPPDTPAAALDEALARLEVGALPAVAAALGAEARAELEARVGRDMAGLDLDEAATGRTRRALEARHLREILGLPRLELSDDASGD